MITLQTPRGSTFQVSRVQAERALNTQGLGSTSNVRSNGQAPRSSPNRSPAAPRAADTGRYNGTTSLGRTTSNGRASSSSPAQGRMSSTMSSTRMNATSSRSPQANRSAIRNQIDRTSSRDFADEYDQNDDEYVVEEPVRGRTERAFSSNPKAKSKVMQNLYLPDHVQKALVEVNKTQGIVPAKGVEVWQVPEVKVDCSKVDSIQQLLRTKMETLAGFSSDPSLVVRKLFKDISKDGTTLNEDAFVRLVTTKFNFQGYESEIQALFKRFDVDRSGSVDVKEFLDIVLSKGAANYGTVIGRVREVLAKRAGGVSSLKSFATQFKLLDTEKDGTVNRQELEWGFTKFLRGFGLQLSDRELDALFGVFDVDSDGRITYDEFVHGIRGGMNDTRVAFVKQAFNIIDTDGSGTLTVTEIASRYDVSKHPQVLAGKMTPVDAIKNFMLQWQAHSKQKDDIITLEEFIDYYDWISMSIDRDDYFELMMRNAWHISGGSGWSENTSNIRVLVTHQDGRQSIETLKDDLGVKQGDTEEIKRRLLKQGIKARTVSLRDASEI